jgi:geranylgeranyl reductase family protein
MPLFSSPISLNMAQTHVYEVIVVGAGPAGSSAAYHLASRGVDVLLVDRFAFPRDKRCGDAVMSPSLDELVLMGLSEEEMGRYEKIERIGMWQKNLPGSYRPVEGQRGYVAPCVEFDALLCEHALRHGAAWLDRVSVQEVRLEEGRARLQGNYAGQPVPLQARLVVAADGSGSRLARNLRSGIEQHAAAITGNALTAPQDDRARFTAVRGYFSGIEGLNDALEFYFRAEAGTTYYWIFPCGQGLANVGVIASMAQLRAARTDLEGALITFLQSPEVEGRALRARLEGQLGAAPIAAGLRGTALYGERLLCVGDAAALVNPVSAEGISSALWSGRIAAETAADALARDDCSMEALSPYGSAVREKYQVMYDMLLGSPIR